MSRNYDNWERLVAAVVKREQIWQLCHQDSISTVSSDYSCRLDLTVGVNDAFEFLRRLSEHNFTTTDVVRVVQDVQLSDQQYLATGTKAVIKSLNSVKITEDEFEQHMTVLGNCRHENVATPSAYHFSDTTKLVVYDYYRRGSVFDMLHGNKSRPSWKSRLRIAIGAAQGIAHIHTQCGGEMVHGNIKSSNIFLNRQHYGCVSDFGLAGIVERPQTSRHRAYEHGIENPSQKNDVYSFGLLLIELITREPPAQAFYVVDRLHSFQPYEWKLRSIRHKTLLLVDEVAEMEVGSSVFVDEKLMDMAVQKELRKMLEAAKRCLALLAEERPAMSQVVLELNNIAYSSLLPGDQIPSPSYQNSVSSDLSAHKSGDKKRVWNRYLRFGTRQVPTEPRFLWLVTWISCGDVRN